MRLIDADALFVHEMEADRMGAMLVVGKGYILAAPTVEAVPMSCGCWEWFEEQNGNPIDGYDHNWGWRCSSCKAELDDSFDDPDQLPTFNFCPHCGADMRSSKPSMKVETLMYTPPAPTPGMQEAMDDFIGKKRDFKCCATCNHWVCTYQQCTNPDQRATEAGEYESSPYKVCELYECNPELGGGYTGSLKGQN